MATISKEVNIDILEKLPDGTFKKKNPSTTIENISKLREELDSLEHESGSNDDGYWTKLPDGTLICYFLDPVREFTSTASGGVYYHNKWFDFPMPFVNLPSVSPAIRRRLGSVVWGGHRQLEMGRVELFLIGNASDGDAHHGYIAIGRWK